jgi:putative transposase
MACGANSAGSKVDARRMLVTYKYRLYPTKAQDEFLSSQLRAACDLYNAALQERRDAWKIARKSINYYDQANQLKTIRAEGLTALVNYTSCQQVLRRVDQTFAAFFARCRRGQTPGFPRFKAWRRYDSLAFVAWNGFRVLGRRLRVQGAGTIKIKLHRPIDGTIKRATIKREIGHWYVCFSVEREPVPLPVATAEVGIDVGLASFAALSDGTAIANPRHVRNAARYLRRCHRRVARRTRGSQRRRKAVALLAKRHRATQNRRADFHHQISRAIVNRFGMIAIEALNIQGLSRGRLAKSVHDAGWASFFEKLSYKAESAGRELIEVDPRGTSQTCPCGERVAKDLADRWHTCPACDLSDDRDVVSAQVVLQRARIERSRHNVGGLDSCVPREAVSFS